MRGLTVFFVNTQGLSQGAGDLCVAIHDCRPDFVGIVETHLDGASIGNVFAARACCSCS